MSKLNVYNKKLAILNKSSICPFTLEMFICPFTNLYVQNVSVHRNLCQVSSSFLWCYPAKKLEKKGLQAVSPIMVFSKHIGVIRSKDPKSSNVLL